MTWEIKKKTRLRNSSTQWSVNLWDLNNLKNKPEIKSQIDQIIIDRVKRFWKKEAFEYFNQNPLFRKMLKNIRKWACEIHQVLDYLQNHQQYELEINLAFAKKILESFKYASNYKICDHVPWNKIIELISKWLISWEQIWISEKEFDILRAKIFLRSFRYNLFGWIYDPEFEIIKMIADEKLKYEDIEITEKEFLKLRCHKYLHRIIHWEHQPIQMIKYLIEDGKITWSDINLTEKNFNRICAQVYAYDIWAKKIDGTDYNPKKLLALLVVSWKITIKETKLTPQELSEMKRFRSFRWND